MMSVKSWHRAWNSFCSRKSATMHRADRSRLTELSREKLADLSSRELSLGFLGAKPFPKLGTHSAYQASPLLKFAEMAK